MPTPRTIRAPGWRPLWLGVAGLGLVGAAGLLATTAYAPVHPQELLRILVFSPTWIVAGAVALSLRPGNRTGLLMMAVGAAQLPPYLHLNEPVTYTATRIVNGLGIALAVQLVLAFPRGRLTSRATRLVVMAAYVDVLLSGLGWTLVTESCAGCPRNLLLIHDSEVLRRAVGLATLPLDVIVLGSIVVILVRRWRSSGRPTRRALAPVLWTSVATVVFEVALMLSANLLAGTALSNLLGWSETLFTCSFPVAFLVGLLRARLDRGAIADLLVALGRDPSPERARDALASTLGDPSPTTRCCSTTQHWYRLRRRRPGSRWRMLGCRPSSGLASPKCATFANSFATPARRNDLGSNATCTTAHSSGYSASELPCA
jgi:hypothetical protein